MTTELQEPATGVTELPEHISWEDERLCHLYRPDERISMCGKAGELHSPVHWEKGSATCPGCGAPVCVECLLIAS